MRTFFAHFFGYLTPSRRRVRRTLKAAVTPPSVTAGPARRSATSPCRDAAGGSTPSERENAA